ncbi:Transcription factor Iwr1 [Cordyceps fumosorosea ARSEF 2679]|uniref:Transcription factor Iwr1 n=1 Tax=Cordyceps fumosorosea (strain ARSEF 2679) TaxID=1081104 RepID=A0A168ESS5_CORFA|nr:Transcription factor Iwr1 [Cordyceps fumosorosea ARSEF 2679]OAA74167.1 Transcription factor Iwr1 [Cordyceps fumosorosea ARSEF 2679]
MSLPPNVIRVKRKRVEESPVTFLQIDEGVKRHRSDSSHWVYQRRGSTAQPPPKSSPLRADSKPQIQLSTIQDDEPKRGKGAPLPIQDTDKLTPATATRAAEPRRFRVSKAMLAAAAAANGGAAGSVSKRDRYGAPTLFVERARRKKLAPKPRRSMLALNAEAAAAAAAAAAKDVEAKDLKRPGVAKRPRDVSKTTSAAASTEAEAPQQPKATPTDATSNPLPTSLRNRAEEDMSKITADMNEWVMREMGATLRSIEAERQKEARPPAPLSPSRFKPKAPAKRYHERHPDAAAAAATTDVEGDTNMTDASEDEDGDEDDWVIEEYVRIPANSVALDVAPSSDVGFLVLDGEEESLLFFGPQNDEGEDWDEDEEDENAENHYTADYPEDEVDSEDELNRNAYYFRNANASDDEEYDQDAFDDEDEDVYGANGGDDDDARMTRILEQMKRLRASQE